MYVGRPGCGKTRLAVAYEGSFYMKPRGEWWDGYAQEENVIVDDFYGWISFDQLLRVCDRYPLRLPIKGSFVQFTSKRVIFTSNKMVCDWYKFYHFSPDPLYRRITQYKVFNELSNAFIDYQGVTINY